MQRDEVVVAQDPPIEGGLDGLSGMSTGYGPRLLRRTLF